MTLAEYLADEKMSCTAFAARLEVTDSAVSRWVNLRRIPSLSLARRIEEKTGGAVPVSCWPEEPVKATAPVTRRDKRARRFVRRPQSSRRAS